MTSPNTTPSSSSNPWTVVHNSNRNPPPPFVCEPRRGRGGGPPRHNYHAPHLHGHQWRHIVPPPNGRFNGVPPPPRQPVMTEAPIPWHAQQSTLCQSFEQLHTMPSSANQSNIPRPVLNPHWSTPSAPHPLQPDSWLDTPIDSWASTSAAVDEEEKSSPVQRSSDTEVANGKKDDDESLKKWEEDPWQTAMRQMDEEDKLRKKVGLTVNARYKIKEKIAFGSYGSIFAAKDLQQENAEYDVAVKFETPIRGGSHLEYEAKVYRIINTTPMDTHPPLFAVDDAFPPISGEPRPTAVNSDVSISSSLADCPTSTSTTEPQAIGVPRVHWYGREFNHNIMVLDILGPTLEQLMPFCSHKFNMDTLLHMARQMLHRIRHVHRCGFIHRDIKPENFLIGVGQRINMIYLIDFGLARRYRYRAKGELKHIPLRQNRSLVGTARYASVNSHNGLELSRRDDMESFCYVLLYMVHGSQLPWRDNCRQKYAMHKGKMVAYRRIAKMKNAMSPEAMFPPNAAPPQFATLLRYARQLRFDQQPDYDYCESLILHAMQQQGCHLTNAVLQWGEMLATSSEALYTYYCTFKWTLGRGEKAKIDREGGMQRLAPKPQW